MVSVPDRRGNGSQPVSSLSLCLQTCFASILAPVNRGRSLPALSLSPTEEEACPPPPVFWIPSLIAPENLFLVMLNFLSQQIFLIGLEACWSFFVNKATNSNPPPAPCFFPSTDLYYSFPWKPDFSKEVSIHSIFISLLHIYSSTRCNLFSGTIIHHNTLLGPWMTSVAKSYGHFLDLTFLTA